MKILTRYILKEHIGPFFFAILVIMLIFLLNILFRVLGRMLSRGIHIVTILELLSLNLAWILALAVPMAVLVSTLIAFGKFSAENEVTAIKASGISFFQILMPVVVASAFLAVGLIVYNNTILPEFNHRARLLNEDIYRKKPTIKMEPNVVFTDIPNYNIITKEIIELGDSSRMEAVIIDDLTYDDKRRTILAQRGSLKFDKYADRLFFDLYNGEIHEIENDEFSKYQKLKFDRYRINVDFPGLSLKRSESGYRGDREKSVEMMEEDIREHRKSMSERKGKIASIIQNQLVQAFDENLLEKSTSSKAGNESAGTKDDHQYRAQLGIVKKKLANFRNQIEMEKRLIKSYSRNINSLKVEIHKKYSIPVACIIFVFVGAPLGTLTRKGNLGVAGGISGLFYMIYWVSLIGGEMLADRQMLSPVLAMWGANIVVGAFGLYLMLITVKEYRPSWKGFGQKAKGTGKGR